jgi:hypothetical protein
MRYVAVLDPCPLGGLAKSAECFTSDLCRITEWNGRFVLESSSFNHCSKPADVFPLADAMISVVRRIMSLYRGWNCLLNVASIQCIDAEGKRCGNTIRATMTVLITSPTAMAELTAPVHGRPLATAIFEATVKDDKIREALTLFQDTENRWADVYDIIEFLGGPKEIASKRWGTLKEARVVKQTANYYRHLGRPDPSSLPSDPPTLGKASLFAKKALSSWIESRL